MAADFFHMELCTNRLLGTEKAGSNILRTVEKMDSGSWVPDHWDSVEPVRKPYSSDAQANMLAELIEERPKGSGEIFNFLFLHKRKPHMELTVRAVRLNRPHLNSVDIRLEAKPFAGKDGSTRLREIFQNWIVATDAVWGGILYSGQAHKRIAQLTPLERLEKAYWLNFFGLPYVRLIGEEKLRSCPGCEVEEVPGRGFMVQVNGRFDAPKVTKSDELFLALETHLGVDLFAGYGYPAKPCRVPEFDLSEVMLLPSGSPKIN